MTIPSLSALVPPRRRKPWPSLTRRRRERAALVARSLTLISARTSVPLPLMAEDAMLLHLATEDLCWRLAVEDLAKHRPPRGDRAAHDAWRAEQIRLESEREQLAALVAEAVTGL